MTHSVRTRARVRLRVSLSAALLVAVLVAWWVSIRPSNDRIWSADQALLPSVEFAGNLVHIRNIRNFSYTASDRFTPAYYDATYDMSAIESVWFILTPFSTNWRGPAHSFVSFGFADSHFVAISIEARKEVGEDYGILPGLFKRFELMYVIGDERDLIGRRAVYDGGDVYLYPIRGPREKIRQLFVEMLQRATRLPRDPEFYNTLTNNCTSNLVRHVNSITPNRVPHGWKTVLPGYADEVALRLGLIDTGSGVDELRRRFRINERARRHAGSDRFSLAIREPDA